MGEWKKGEIITILLDCDLWKVAFWQGEKKLGVLDILPNRIYYPGFVMFSLEKNEFKLFPLARNRTHPGNSSGKKSTHTAQASNLDGIDYSMMESYTPPHNVMR